jgi:CO/xanthine dehydrogenase Mo-binding subunit
MLAARKAIEQLKGWAAELKGWPEGEVALKDGAFTLGEGEPVPFEVAVGEAVRRRGGPLEFHARYEREHVPQACFAAQVAEVEVDRQTGQVNVLSISTAHDSGRLINPLLAEGQIEGALIQGLGFSIMEELRVEDGRVLNPNFGEYKIPTIRDLPELRMTFLEDAPGPAPFGGRAVAEHSLTPTPAAIANAIADAVGVRLTSTPLTAEKVYGALSG